ncbi:MAG: hypothetical protein F6J96_10070 [Symploca sp. SIO1C2]|nr:hypothetical protein [Symploca sp. SIO1C2]
MIPNPHLKERFIEITYELDEVLPTFTNISFGIKANLLQIIQNSPYSYLTIDEQNIAQYFNQFK